MHENQGMFHVLQHGGPKCWSGLYVVFNNKGDMIF